MSTRPSRLAGVVERLLQALPDRLVEEVPRDHRESDAAFHHRRRVTSVVSVVGAGLLGVSLRQKPDSREFYALTMGVAGTWTLGGLVSGPLHLGWVRSSRNSLHRPVITPVATGVIAFGAFYGCALLARRVPPLSSAITGILRYAHQGSAPLVYTTTLTNGLAEEVFFRGALYAAVGTDRPVLKSTAVYALATTPTRNPALVLAAIVMGALFGQQRRITGGIQAPLLTHVTWSVLMLRYLPPLFREQPSLESPRPHSGG